MDASDARLSQSLIDDEQDPPSTHGQTKVRKILFPWLAIVVVLVISFSVIVSSGSKKASNRDCVTGELSGPGAPTVCRRFTGGLKYDADGKVFRDTSRETVSYTGNSSEVNKAWNVFDAVQTIELQPDEAEIDGLHTGSRSMVMTIPDAFHQLHCLNQIRMALYDSEYHADQNAVGRMHVDHCIDYIRQVIQCRSDLTPLKVYYSESAKRMMVDFEGEHQCRDFDAVVDWAWQHHAKKAHD